MLADMLLPIFNNPTSWLASCSIAEDYLKFKREMKSWWGAVISKESKRREGAPKSARESKRYGRDKGRKIDIFGPPRSAVDVDDENSNPNLCTLPATLTLPR